MATTDQLSWEGLSALVQTWENLYEDNEPPLQDYLRALYKLVQDKKEEQPTLMLFALLLEQSFTAEPLPFCKTWVRHESPPPKRGLKSDFEYLSYVLEFQIAELKSMENGALSNENRYFGVTSPNGNGWYNFDATMNLECGVRGYLQQTNKTQQNKVTWRTLADILEIGRFFE